MGLFRRRNSQPAATAAAQAQSLNEAEQSWIAGNLEQLATSGTDVADPAALGGLYDGLLAHWLSLPVDQRPDPNPDINLIGIGLGEYLRRQTRVLDWAVVTDATGTEMALRGQPGDILIYPVNAVAKRWTGHEFGFLPGFAAEMINAVARIRSGATSG